LVVCLLDGICSFEDLFLKNQF